MRVLLIALLAAISYAQTEVESAVSGGECQSCASAYERDGGCTYALKGNWFQMDMPDECYLKLNEKSRVNCRNKVIDHCISVGGDVKVSPQPSRNSFIATKVMPSEGCQACAAAYERDGGCQYALKGKWFKMKMPDECYLSVNEKSGADCRNEVIDHCKSIEVESAVSDGECQECADAYKRDGGCKYALKGKWYKMKMPDECYLNANRKSRVDCRREVIHNCKSIEVESAVSGGECQSCAAAYERDGGCTYALKGKWYKMKMPDECYLDVNDKSRKDCRNEVIEHCKSVDDYITIMPKEIVEQKVVPSQPNRNSFVGEGCQACAAAYERDGGCKYALKGKWYKMKMPDECYLDVNEKSREDCRNEVIDHCRSVEVESAVSVGEVESAISKGQCKACAAEYEEAGGCKYALKGKWFKIQMPDKCYLNVNRKSRKDCRKEVIQHCKKVGITQSVLNYSTNIFAIIGFLSLMYGFSTIYRTFTAKAEYDHIDDLEF